MLKGYYFTEVNGSSTYRYPLCHVFQTPNQLSEKYFDYLATRGYEQSKLSPKAFDAIWTAAKALTASIDRLQPNKTLDHFSYDNERMTKIFFESLTRLQFDGASVSHLFLQYHISVILFLK